MPKEKQDILHKQHENNFHSRQSMCIDQSSYTVENIRFPYSVVYNSTLFWVRKALRPMWWEEVYRWTSVCKSGRFCCHNTVNSPHHHPKHSSSSMAIYETLKTCRNTAVLTVTYCSHWSAHESLIVREVRRFLGFLRSTSVSVILWGTAFMRFYVPGCEVYVRESPWLQSYIYRCGPPPHLSATGAADSTRERRYLSSGGSSVVAYSLLSPLWMVRETRYSSCSDNGHWQSKLFLQTVNVFNQHNYCFNSCSKKKNKSMF